MALESLSQSLTAIGGHSVGDLFIDHCRAGSTSGCYPLIRVDLVGQLVLEPLQGIRGGVCPTQAASELCRKENGSPCFCLKRRVCLFDWLLSFTNANTTVILKDQTTEKHSKEKMKAPLPFTEVTIEMD